MTATDSELLQRYAKARDESAFAELVQRYVNLVYFTALRQAEQHTHRAEDATQRVFILLADKASTLATHQTLAGWLHTTARYVANEISRNERRRHTREQEAYAMNETDNDPSSTANWDQLRPVIDETMHELSDQDREVVLLRFFANLAHAQIGEKLNLSENTARMRVERALDKIRALLAKRGITSTAAALSFALANQALASAPAGLAATVTTTALATATAGSATTFATAKIISFMSTTKFIVVTAGIITVAATVVTWHQARNNAESQTEIAALRTEAATLHTENQQLIAQKKAGEHLNGSAGHAASPGNKDSASTVVTEQTLPTPPANPLDKGSEIPADKISVDVAAKQKGRDTPVDAARTLLWYIQGGDIKHASELLAFEPAEKNKLKDFIDTLPEEIQDKYGTPAKLVAFAMSGSPRQLSNVQLLSETTPDDYTTIQHVRLEYKNGEVREDELKFHRDVDGWKQVVSPASVDRIISYLKKKT